MKTQRKAWAVMVAAFLASIVIAINQFKVPPVMQALMTDLGADMVTGGWFMSIVSVASLVLVLPGAFILMRLGLKVTGLLALGCTLLGTVIGALAPNADTLLLGRMVEGGGAGLIMVTAPAAISAWFEPQERGLPMGIWAAWVPIGNVIVFNLAQPLMAVFGWQSVWWFGAVVVVAAMILYALVVTEPPGAAQHDRPTARDTGRMMLNPTTWLLGLGFGAFSFSLLGYNTWAPAFLNDTLGLDRAAANSDASIMFLAAIPANIVAGWVLGRMRDRSVLLPLAFAVTGALFFWSFRLRTVGVVAPYMIALGLVSNFIPATTFTLAPESMPRAQFAGLSLAVVGVISGIGSLVGPPVLGALLSGGDWSSGSIYLVIIMGFGTIASILVGRRIDKR